MSAVFGRQLEELEDLEQGLKRLCRSQLMAIPEFKDLYLAIERHTRNIKLAHLTGKAKDLQNKAERDTKLFTILVKMLWEAEDQPKGGQKESLRRVHTWYMTNRHVLFCGPRFGKDHFKDEVKQIPHKAQIPKHIDLVSSTKEQPLSQKVVSNGSEKIISEIEVEPVQCEETPPSSAVSPREEDRAQELGSPSSYEQSIVSESHSATISPDVDELSLELQLDFNDKDLLLSQEQASVEDSGRTSTKSSSPSSPSMLLRPKVEIPGTFPPLKEQPNCLTESMTAIRNMIHPISSLVNPHSVMTKIQSTETPGLQDDKLFTPVRDVSGKPSRSESFQTWQTFKEQKCYEQEVISRLNFLGRSGTPIDIRYSAHSQGENPEAYTQDFLEHLTRHGTSLTKQENCEENVFVQKTLEEFYKTVENISPSLWSMFRNSLSAKVRSTASTNENGQNIEQESFRDKKSKPTQNVHHYLRHCLAKWFGQTGEASLENDTGTNLNTMISMIDSVTKSMTCYKEKFAPEPQLGFRQPSATELEIPSVLSSSNRFGATTDYGCLTPPAIHKNGNEVTRQFSSSLTSSLGINKDMPDGLTKAKVRCMSAGIVDWRGAVQPDIIQDKWPNTIFGGHTYLKKWRRPNQRSAGSTSAGGRPKTTPMATKEKWKTQRPSDNNTRAIQAASHSTTIVNQVDVDSMIQVQHLLSHKNSSRPDPIDSFKFEIAERKKYTKTDSQVTEYLLFIAPPATVLVEPKPDNYTQSPHKVEERTHPVQSGSGGYDDEDVNIHVPCPQYDEDALNIAVGEEFQSLVKDHSQTTSTIERHKQEVKKKHTANDNQLKSGHLACEQSRPGNMAARVQRSAGRMPDHLYSTTAHTIPIRHFQNNALRRVSPLRTPASIPSSRTTSSKFESRSGQIFLELEHHARKTNNPTEFMTKVEGLRRTQSSQHPYLITNLVENSPIGTSLQICRPPLSHRRISSNTLSHDILTKTELVTCAGHSSRTTAFDEQSTWMASSPGHIPALIPSEDLLIHRNTSFTDSALKLTGRQGMLDAHTTSSARAASKTQRPIAQVFQTPDPDELLRAVQIQNEAAAAVDIQRIFRGYVARNVYRSLQSEERQKREEARKAAIRIQRLYRSHIRRKQAIYNRSHIKPELVEWSRDVAEIKAENAAKRQARMTSWTSEINSKHREAKSKLAVIGPHVEVYSAYHPKIVGPSKHELNAAAVKIQKIVKGWLLRRKIKKLTKKAIWHGSSFSKLTNDYKAMLKRVQQQHGVDKPKTPFSIKDFNVYIDLRRRYESVFEKRSFGGELEHGALDAFFKECDLYPSRTEVEEALDVTTHGQASRRERKGVTKKELMDMIFYIYVPAATGLRGTRRSTWMSPIIDGQEARQMLGSEFVEPAPLAPCIKLVIEAKRAQRQRDQTQKDADQRSRIEEAEKRIEEDKQAGRKSKKVMFDKTLTTDS